jgi:hypothetical protein
MKDMWCALVLSLHCKTCNWRVLQEHNDPGGKMLEILKDIHEMTFKDHKCEKTGGNPQRNEL